MVRAMPEAPLPKEIVLADSATKLGAEAPGAVIVTGSHGARYAAYLTLRVHPRAVIHSDAGVGKDRAGVACLDLAETLGVAAATASHATCRIGDATDMIARGRISHANATARTLGVHEDMPVREAAQLLIAARPTGRDPAPIAEARRTLQEPGWQRGIVLMDSASLVKPEDEGQIVVTASHGALVGGQASAALRVQGFAAVYSDAGVGIDGAGISRLPALDGMGIAGLTVSAESARIGEARSVYDDGVVSHVNETARRLGATPGEPLKARLLVWAKGSPLT
jgi:hypothetical protein